MKNMIFYLILLFSFQSFGYTSFEFEEISDLFYEALEISFEVENNKDLSVEENKERLLDLGYNPILVEEIALEEQNLSKFSLGNEFQVSSMRVDMGTVGGN